MVLYLVNQLYSYCFIYKYKIYIHKFLNNFFQVLYKTIREVRLDISQNKKNAIKQNLKLEYNKRLLQSNCKIKKSF